MSTDEDDTQIRAVRDLVGPPAGDRGKAYIVVLSGRSVGRMYRVKSGTMTVGRDPLCDIHVDDEGVSRRHAAIETRSDDSSVRDLASTNGTWVEGDRIRERPFTLHDGTRIRVGPVTILKYGVQDSVEQNFLSQLYQSATRDGLTGVYNKRFFLDQLRKELAWHKRHDQPLTLMFVDIDHFKRVNDTYGHQAGDDVLHQLAAELNRACRTEDILARYGGEEFSVILRLTSPAEAANIAARLRESVERHPFNHGKMAIPITVSIGVVTRSGAKIGDAEALIGEADRLLYEAKEQGRNRVVRYPND
jgi:diguanylate cyclase (GGDEF)-like protein